MLTLQKVKEKTEEIFEEGKEFKIPEPPVHLKDKLAALKESKLERQYRRCLFDVRVDQAKAVGFVPLTVGDMAEMLMGEPHTTAEVQWWLNAADYGWVYNHHQDKIESNSPISVHPTDFIRKGGFWTFDKDIWRCRFASLDYLKDIPYGVVLRINELKKFKFFNAFNAMAPREAWVEDVFTADPIVVATIWEMPSEEKSTGDRQHFFVAQW